MSSAERIWIVIPAGGSGSRMGAAIPKQYLLLAGRPILERTVNLFLARSDVSGVVVAVADEDAHWSTLSVGSDTRVHRVAAGAERVDSVLSALRYLRQLAMPGDWVLVHDAARPCLPAADLERLLDELREDAVGGLLARPSVDTVKWQADDGSVEKTLPRDRVWLAQTPQMFRYPLLMHCIDAALAEGVAITDEASAIEFAGHAPRLVLGSPENIKITQPFDLHLAEVIHTQESHS